MTTNETLFEAVGMIDRVHIEEGEAFGFRQIRRARALKRAACASAAALVLLGAAFASARFIKKPDPEKAAILPVSPTETENASSEPSEEARIIWGEAYLLHDLVVPNPGEIVISESLAEALEKAENDGCLFAVQIRYIPIYSEAVKAYQEERDRRLKALWDDPIIVQFMDAFYEYNTPFHDYTTGELQHYYRIWAADQTEDVLETFAEAKKRLDDFYMSPPEVSIDTIIEQEVIREFEWLKSQGYPIENKDGTAYLTKEQILEFPKEYPDAAFEIVFQVTETEIESIASLIRNNK